MFNDTEWMHAQSIAGLNWGNVNSKDYFGLSFSSRSSVSSAHFITVSQEDIKRASKSSFSTAAVSDPTSVNRRQAIKKLEEDYKAKEKIYQDFQKQADSKGSQGQSNQGSATVTEPSKPSAGSAELLNRLKTHLICVTNGNKREVIGIILIVQGKLLLIVGRETIISNQMV